MSVLRCCPWLCSCFVFEDAIGALLCLLCVCVCFPGLFLQDVALESEPMVVECGLERLLFGRKVPKPLQHPQEFVSERELCDTPPAQFEEYSRNLNFKPCVKLPLPTNSLPQTLP